MTKKYFIETFGCQMNALDSEKIAGSFNSSGLSLAEDPSEADIIILNTCSVREKAVQKVYTRLGEIKKFKSQDLIVGVVGCMAQLEGGKIFKRAPFVKLIAGPQKGHVMHQLVERCAQSQTTVVDMRIDEAPSPLENPHIFRRSVWRASVTISEGCNRQCSFCIVPLTRGKERNRKSVDIVHEIEDLVSRGYIEILLLGQTVNSYIDRLSENMNFAGLLKRLAEIDGLKRIRFTSPYPGDFSDELLDVMVSYPKICNHVHLPVQSGSNRVLHSMRRGYTRENYLKVIKNIQKASRPIAISTDIIVGFPGETDLDFQDTLILLDEVQYDSAFSFKYSKRPNTVAAGLPDEISEEEKGERLSIVQERQQLIQYNKNAAYMDQSLDVLVEDKARSRVNLMGRTSNNKIVNFNGPENLLGRMVAVKITGFSPNSLKGIWIQSVEMNQSGIA